ncbi:MAG: hypothetical protein WD605_00705 [Candidatus Paceibacterota bacterium]
MINFMNSPTVKLFIFSLLFFAAAAALATYIMYEQERDGERIYSSLAYLKSWEALQHSGVTEEQIEKNRSEKEKVKAITLASEGEAVKFLAMVDELAVKTGVTIVVSNLKVEKTKEAGFNELSATLLLRGERVSVEGLLEVFELLPYRSHTTNLSLSRNADGTAEASLSLVISVRK